MPKIITLTNNKGGTGKTPATWHTGHALARDHNVLLVDMDPQANLTRRAYSDTKLIHIGRALGGANRPDHSLSDIMRPITSNLYIAPGHADLENTAHGLDSRTWAADRFGALRQAITSDHRVSTWIDYILIDTPSTLGTLTVNALAASDWVVIPARPDTDSLCGAIAVMDMVDEIRRNLPQGPRIMGVVANQVEPSTLRHREALESLRDNDYPPLLAELDKRIGANSEAELAEQYAGLAAHIEAVTA